MCVRVCSVGDPGHTTVSGFFRLSLWKSCQEMVLELVRKLDSESADVSIQASLVREFCESMRTLFLDGQIWSSDNDGTWVRHTLDQAKDLGLWPADQAELKILLGKVHGRVSTYDSFLEHQHLKVFPFQIIFSLKSCLMRALCIFQRQGPNHSRGCAGRVSRSGTGQSARGSCA